MSGADDAPVKLFGDPRSAMAARGPDRRARTNDDDQRAADARSAVLALEIERHHLTTERASGAGRALRLGRGDGFATALNVLGVLVFATSVIAGSIILYNANDVGAFSDPFNSNRVAIGLAVLALGIVHSAILVGVARAITYQLASVRLRLKDGERHESGPTQLGSTPLG